MEFHNYYKEIRIFYLVEFHDIDKVFDEICACVCRELKKEYDGIEIVYITPYISLSEQNKIKRMMEDKLIDFSLYPPVEQVPPRFAILKRNEWMIKNADLLIVYVNHSYGGAHNCLLYAQKLNKRIINLADAPE